MQFPPEVRPAGQALVFFDVSTTIARTRQHRQRISPTRHRPRPGSRFFNAWHKVQGGRNAILILQGSQILPFRQPGLTEVYIPFLQRANETTTRQCLTLQLFGATSPWVPQSSLAGLRCATARQQPSQTPARLHAVLSRTGIMSGVEYRMRRPQLVRIGVYYHSRSQVKCVDSTNKYIFDRWKSPQPLDKENKLLNATTYGFTCPQAYRPDFNFSVQDEDCLNLNIWAPPSGRKRPVFVYIYGGAMVRSIASPYTQPP
jgi:hypothetical protein